MKGTPLLVSPLTLTTTLPVEALDGTRMVIEVSDQAVDTAERAVDGDVTVALGRAEASPGNGDQRRRSSVVGADAGDLRGRQR